METKKNNSKLEKFLKGLKKSQDALHALEAFGIDVDRLIGISNAQGPQAKIVRAVMSAAAEMTDRDTFFDDAEQLHHAGVKHPRLDAPVKRLPRKARGSKLVSKKSA